MDYKVIWTEEALTDIELIAQYIEKDSFCYALSVVSKIIDTSKLISTFPLSGRMIPEVENEFVREHFIYQEGQAVFKWAVSKMADVSVEMMKRHNITPETLAWLVPHQANMRIIEATANRMGIEKDQVMINIQKYGNTTSGTLPLCLWDYEKQLKKGDNIILSAFGGGFTWGAIYIKWAYDSE